MGIISLLASDNYIVVNKDILKKFGINVTLMLGELASEYNYWDKDGKLENGMFYSTIENIEENTGLSKYRQSEALKTLSELGVVQTVVKGQPAKRFFKLDIEKLENLFSNNLTSSCQKTGKLDGEKLETNNNNKTGIKNSNKNIYKQVVDLFNETCVSFPKVTALSERRKKSIHARLTTYTMDDLKKCFEMAEGSDFLKGKNNRDWQANFDWMIKDANMAKILDGNYSNKGDRKAENPKVQDTDDPEPVVLDRPLGQDFIVNGHFDRQAYDKAEKEYHDSIHANYEWKKARGLAK